MALRIVADKLEELPEGLRESAKQEGTVFLVTAMPEGWAIEHVAGLKQSVVTARSERDEAKRMAKAFEGLDPEKAAEAREALEKLAAGQLRGSKEIDEFKSSIEAKFADDRKKAEAREAALLEQVKTLRTRGELAPVIAKMGGGEAMDAIMTLAAQNIRYEQDANGQLKASLVDKDGKPLVTRRAGSADPMGFEEFIEQMRDAPATRGLFKASATGGAGSASQSGGSARGGDSGQQMSARDLLSRGLAKLAAR